MFMLTNVVPYAFVSFGFLLSLKKNSINMQAICLLLYVQAMVHYNRIELLNHPVCKKYLAMKWCVFAI